MNAQGKSSTIAAVAAITLVTGCGSSTPAQVDKVGLAKAYTAANGITYTGSAQQLAAIDKLVTLTHKDCAKDYTTSAARLQVAMFIDAGQAANTRIAMSYVCPDKLPAWDQAVHDINALPK